jgi:hypothetical protein
MPHPMLYGSCLRGYTPYAQGLRSGSTEWIILQRMARKGKLANPFILFGAMIFHVLYYPLYMLIMQVYHDSSRMCDFGRMPDSDQKI